MENVKQDSAEELMEEREEKAAKDKETLEGKDPFAVQRGTNSSTSDGSGGGGGPATAGSGPVSGDPGPATR